MSISTAQFVILGVAAFALTGLLTWPVRALAIRLGAMDAPNMARKTQAEPVPYLGGVAIALGISLITLGAVFVGADNFAGENNDQLKDCRRWCLARWDCLMICAHYRHGHD
jgi:UDP-N-acetylmuramyl pentapeptide phosphotransferase/UDP-N-acetylglucosamine-1-phosphate transferase